MDKELNEAIEYLKLIRKNHDLEKKGYVYTEEAINIVLNRLEKYEKQLDLDYVDKNYISKKKIEDKIEELNKNIDLSIDNSKGGLDEDFIDKGTELLAKKRILQELLEDK